MSAVRRSLPKWRAAEPDEKGHLQKFERLTRWDALCTLPSHSKDV
jgi:hypothetical protein